MNLTVILKKTQGDDLTNSGRDPITLQQEPWDV